MVEVGGIEPPSLSNRVKAATCLVYLLSLNLRAPVNRIAQAAAFKESRPDHKGKFIGASLLIGSRLGHRQPKERPAFLVRQDCAKRYTRGDH